MGIVFNAVKHRYTVDGVELPSVTTIMSAIGVGGNYKHVPSGVLSQAANRGTVAHEAFAELWEGRGCTCEQQLACELFAGTVDMITPLADDGTVKIYDYKTTAARHDDSWAWQLGFYKYLVEHTLGHKVSYTGVMWQPHAEGEVTVIDITPRSEEDILRAVEIYKAGGQWDSAQDIPVDIQRAIDEMGEWQVRVKQLEDATAQMKAEHIDPYRTRISEWMSTSNVATLRGKAVTCSWIAPKDVVSYDIERLVTDHPDIMAQYEQHSMKAGYLRTTIKKTKKDENGKSN